MSSNAEPPLFGLVLAGGHSRRMHRDKAALSYAGRPQLVRAIELLSGFTERCFVSVRADQRNEPLRAAWPQIVDASGASGPLAGILAAQQAEPHAAWWVLACDLPLLRAATLEHLRQHRAIEKLATAYLSAHDGLPEPLCAIYEPASAIPLGDYARAGGQCPRKFLLRAAAELLPALSAQALDNVNSAADYWRAMQSTSLRNPEQPITLQIKYFALLREQAGCASESLQSRAGSAADLYRELQQRHGFSLPQEMLRVAVNGEFADWQVPLTAGDEVVFIPPVAGG